MNPTPQQEAVISWVAKGRGNARVIARAGTGKTSLLLMTFPAMYPGNVAATAYNKGIAEELAAKVKNSGMFHADVATSHAFGRRTWLKHPDAKRCKFDLGGSEWFREVQTVLADAGQELQPPVKPFVKAAINYARQQAIGIVCPLNHPTAWLDLVKKYSLEDKLFEAPSEVAPSIRDQMLKNALRAAHKFLRASIQIGHRISDGDGMIYLPLIHDVRFDQYDWCVMDEAQDVNPLRRVQFKRQLKAGGRALFVGDDRQAINAWAGADSDSLDIIEREFSTRTFPLTVTWRCPKVVVERAKALVPDYEAAPQAPQGRIGRTTLDEFSAPERLKALQPGVDAVLCRNTRPLVDMAFAMVRHGVPCYIEGKALSSALVGLATRWKRVKTISGLRTKLEDHLARETQRLMALDREEAADRLNDEVEALFAFMAGMPQSTQIDALVVKIRAMFADTKDAKGKPQGITLLTCHKSKGLEFPKIHLLGANRYMPSRWARSEEAYGQEMNLLYVAWTRAQEELNDIDVPLE